MLDSRLARSASTRHFDAIFASGGTVSYKKILDCSLKLSCRWGISTNMLFCIENDSTVRDRPICRNRNYAYRLDA